MLLKNLHNIKVPQTKLVWNSVFANTLHFDISQFELNCFLSRWA